MQTDSIVRRLALAALLAGLAVAGCARAPIVHDELLQPLGVRQPWLPEPEDLAAARLARVALVSTARDGAADPAVAEALAELEALEIPEEQEDLLPLAIDLRNATLDDPLAYRAGARALKKRWDLDPRLEGRIDRTIGDDPLRLAGRRQFDGWHRLWARTFNAVVEPIGSSAISGFVLAPYQLANSIIHYFAEFSNAEPLSITDRQALALREEFLARHPETEATPELERKIARDRIKLDATLAARRLRASEQAFEAGQPDLALHQAERARALVDRHPEENGRLRRRADRAIEAARTEREGRDIRHARALEAWPSPPDLIEAERSTAIQLLAAPDHSAAFAQAVDAYRRVARDRARQAGGRAYARDLEAHVEGRVDFLRALGQHERGFESAGRVRLSRVANRNPERDTMARHARALLDDDWQNPFGAFERLRRKAVRDEAAWRLAGEWVRRPRYPNLPVPVAYLIDAPTIAVTIILAPLRLLISPITGGTPDFRRGTALAGYRYLIRYPAGEQQTDVIDWLYAYELDQERWGRALRMADWVPEFDPEERAELVEKTTAQRVDRVERLDRRDERASILSGVAREFPDSQGGRRAGLAARAERLDASPQLIRITKSFLLENPSVAGPNGIGLNPALLDDDPSTGELHPEGIVLRGGRVLEIRLIAEGKEDEDPPEVRVIEVSPKRLRQLASTLDEAVQRNSLIDVGARQESDANRDSFLERAGLGLADDLDLRPSAQSSFVYRSLRERYGMVRGRDSVLPFDLVFRGSLGDFTLGAFPRWRAPRETPDAFLYR